jgi:glutamine amidotransferase
LITIIDYGVGNLGSVAKAFRYLGETPMVTSDPDQIIKADKLVLPGVGAFGDAINRLEVSGIKDAIRMWVKKGDSFLGICLGMQLLATIGEEGGTFTGLNLIPGKVRRIKEGVKLPHVGWNQLAILRDEFLFKQTLPNPQVYFVHSYCFDPEDFHDVMATTDYGETVIAAIKRDNLTGVQFHPEKSSQTGLQILSNFIKGGQ